MSVPAVMAGAGQSWCLVAPGDSSQDCRGSFPRGRCRRSSIAPTEETIVDLARDADLIIGVGTTAAVVRRDQILVRMTHRHFAIFRTRVKPYCVYNSSGPVCR